MQKALIIISLLLGAAFTAGSALACSDCTTPVEVANCCSKNIFHNSKVLKHRVHCEFPAHRCAFPLSWDCEPCIEPMCHMPAVPCEIDREICIDAPCHRPAIALRPVECCLCGIELTGTKDLIVLCDDCSSHD